MKRIRVLLYSIPLFLSVLFVIFFYQELTEYFGYQWTWIVMTGAMAWLLLFDIFESRGVKRSNETKVTVCRSEP